MLWVFAGIQIIGGLATEPSCRLALVQAGALPLLLAGMQADHGCEGDGRALRRSCMLVLDLITGTGDFESDPVAEQERLECVQTMGEMLAVECPSADLTREHQGFADGMVSKTAGNAHFKAGRFQEAADEYADALRKLPWMPVLE